jgi:hypothetical protein
MHIIVMLVEILHVTNAGMFVCITSIYIHNLHTYVHNSLSIVNFCICMY